MTPKKTSKSKTLGSARKGKAVAVKSCKQLKAAIAREIKASVKDKAMSAKLINSLGTEVAYGTGGGGGGIGVA